MAKLAAKFSISPNFPLIVECEKGDQYSYSFSEEEFEIQINLPIMDGSPKSGFVDSNLYKQLVDRVEIVVTKEVGTIPEIPLTENGGRDYSKVSQYFDGLKNGYSEIAEFFYKRLIQYLKFELKQPHQNHEYTNRDQFSNPSWTSDNGINYGTVSFVHHVKPIPGMHGDSLGVETLKIEHKSSIARYLKHEIKIELFQEIMSDAQAAVFSGDIRRAVFEMAVVCELSTKRKYFAEGGISGLAFDYFEDKGKVKVTVIELISNVALEVIGESFKSQSPEDFINIDYLFRCRNKVAHRGDVVFKDDSGVLIRPDLRLVKNWFMSVMNLLAWLSSK